jgi:hypothetical protein
MAGFETKMQVCRVQLRTSVHMCLRFSFAILISDEHLIAAWRHLAVELAVAWDKRKFSGFFDCDAATSGVALFGNACRIAQTNPIPTGILTKEDFMQISSREKSEASGNDYCAEIQQYHFPFMGFYVSFLHCDICGWNRINCQ